MSMNIIIMSHERSLNKAEGLLKMMDNSQRNTIPILSAEADLALAQRKFNQAEKLYSSTKSN